MHTEPPIRRIINSAGKVWIRNRPGALADICELMSLERSNHKKQK